jgi:O-antigen/teichoic acid export membrane protein
MSTRTDVDEVESTRSERFLGVVLTGFLLVGTIWLYVKISDWLPEDELVGRGFRGHWVHHPHNVVIAAAIQAVFIAAWLVASYALLVRLRRRNSRFLPLGFAAVATGVVMVLIFAVDYVGRYVAEWGILVLSVLGAAITVGAFVWLQKWLSRRIPARRVRKGECPFCGFPVRDHGPHCEGCGREVLADCVACSAQRRVGATHCAACGAN